MSNVPNYTLEEALKKLNDSHHVVLDADDTRDLLHGLGVSTNAAAEYTEKSGGQFYDDPPFFTINGTPDGVRPFRRGERQKYRALAYELGLNAVTYAIERLGNEITCHSVEHRKAAIEQLEKARDRIKSYEQGVPYVIGFTGNDIAAFACRSLGVPREYGAFEGRTSFQHNCVAAIREHYNRVGGQNDETGVG